MTSLRKLLGLSRWSRAVLGLGMLATLITACSLLLDTGRDQCQSDSDCDFISKQHTCQAGLCSDLGPRGCYAGTPNSMNPDELQKQFKNQCSRATVVPFDNCVRLGMCGSASSLPPTIMPVPITGTTPPQPGPAPMLECIGANPVVVVGGSTAVQPFLSVVAPLLAADTAPFTIIYQPSGSCNGVDGLFSPDPTKHMIKDIPNRPALLFHADGSSEPCTFTAPTQLDVAVSDVFASSCNSSYEVSDTLAEYLGPIQPMTFVVPATSSEKSISAAMAHIVFGRGNTDMTDMPYLPYTDPTLYFVRNASSGTQQMVSRAIDVDARRWWGIDRGGSSAVRDQLEAVNPARASAAIGILSTDFADPERQRLRIVAFQAKGQLCGYYPDSTLNTRDKINVRDGHYAIWGPVHFFAQVNNGLPGPAAAALVTRFTRTRLDRTLLDAIIKSGLVPPCAMQVQRNSEMGPITAYQPPGACGCYFEAKVPDGQAPASCRACAGPADCPSLAPACNNGFCEPQ